MCLEEQREGRVRRAKESSSFLYIYEGSATGSVRSSTLPEANGNAPWRSGVSQPTSKQQKADPETSLEGVRLLPKLTLVPLKLTWKATHITHWKQHRIWNETKQDARPSDLVTKCSVIPWSWTSWKPLRTWLSSTVREVKEPKPGIIEN